MPCQDRKEQSALDVKPPSICHDFFKHKAKVRTNLPECGVDELYGNASSVLKRARLWCVGTVMREISQRWDDAETTPRPASNLHQMIGDGC
jgi:hypothetical protein